MTQLSMQAAFDAPLVDQPRLRSHLQRVYLLMVDGEWRTLQAIAEYAGCSEAGASARLRDLRKARFGGFTVEKRRLREGGGTYLYRMVTARRTA